MEDSRNSLYRLIADSLARWIRHDAPLLSAAMAFYALISIGPLAMIAVGLIGRLAGAATVRTYIVEMMSTPLDESTLELLRQILETRWSPGTDVLGTMLAMAMLVLASTAGYNHLRSSLNRIFESPPREQGRVLSAVRGRILSFLLVLASGAILLISLGLRSVMTALDARISDVLAVPAPLLSISELVSFLVTLTGLFAVMFRVLPDRKLSWRPLLLGALVTTVLFLMGEWVIGQYMGRVNMGSAFGVAGSAVVLAVWVYYSAMVVFLGASVTCTHAEATGFVTPPASSAPPEAGSRDAVLPMLLVALGLGALGGAFAPGALAAQDRAAEVRVSVSGVPNGLRDNVFATMTLARTPSRARLTRTQIRAQLERAPGEVRAALEPFGYYEAAVRDSVRFDGRRWQVTLTVTPGPAVILTRADVRIEGPGTVDTAFTNVRERTPLAVGQPLLHPAWDALKSGLAGAAADRGYLDAAFDSSVIRVDRTQRTAEAVLVLQTGPRYQLGEVTFIQEGLDPDLLEPMVPWDSGDPFTSRDLLALHTALSDGPYFSSVEVVPRRDLATGLVVPVEVTLTLTRPQLYALGGGYGTDTGARVTFNAELRRLNRMGHRAELDAWLAQNERRATGSYMIPLGDRFGSLVTLNGGWVDADPTTSTSETWLVGATLEGLRNVWRAQLSATLERATWEVGPQEGVSNLLLLGTGLSRVRADDRIAPSRGSLLRFRLRGGHDALVSNVRVLDGGVEARWIRGFGGRWRILTRGEAAALGTSSFDELPPSLRYFAGGDRSVRGYGYQELGPDDGLGNVIGGRGLLVMSVELDARVRTDWRLAVFGDVGNAVNALGDPLEAGAGAGIRWRSPIGMVRLDGAFAVTQPGWPFRIHVNLGPEL